MNGCWDLSYLYKSFSDEAFRRDLESLPKEAERLQALLSDESLPAGEKLERFLEEDEKLSARVDALANYIMCTQAVDAENEEANAANDQLEAAFTSLSLLSSACTRFVAGLEDLEALIAASPKLQAVSFALREMKDDAAHLLPPAAEPWILELQLSGGNAFSQLRDKLDSTLSVDFRDERLPLSAVRGKAYDPDPAVRRDAYEAELAAYPKMDLPMSFCLNSIKMEARTLAKARGFDSVLDMTLHSSRMDRATLDAMWNAIRKYLPDFRRYLKAKAKLLGHKTACPSMTCSRRWAKAQRPIPPKKPGKSSSVKWASSPRTWRRSSTTPSPAAGSTCIPGTARQAAPSAPPCILPTAPW